MYNWGEVTTVQKEGWKRLKAEDIEGQPSVTGKQHKLIDKWGNTRKGKLGNMYLVIVQQLIFDSFPGKWQYTTRNCFLSENYSEIDWEGENSYMFLYCYGVIWALVKVSRKNLSMLNDTVYLKSIITKQVCSCTTKLALSHIQKKMTLYFVQKFVVACSSCFPRWQSASPSTPLLQPAPLTHCWRLQSWHTCVRTASEFVFLPS